MTPNKQTELMSNTPVTKAILKMSIPVVLGMMVQVLYNLVDTFFIGMLNDPRVKAIIKTGMLMTTGIGIVLTMLFGIFASGLISIFTSLPEVIAEGATVLTIYMWSFLVLGPQMLASTTIQAFGKAKASLLLSIARQGLFYIPLLFLLSSRFLFKGLLWAQPISDAITLSLALVLLVFILKTYQQGNKEETTD